MSTVYGPPRVAADWPARPESREACAERAFTLVTRLTNLLGDDRVIRCNDNILSSVTVDTISACLKQSMTQDDPIQPIEKMGWHAAFYLGHDEERLWFSARCGAWALGGGSIGQFVGPKSRCKDTAFLRQILKAIVECYEPDRGSVFSNLGSARRAELNLPFPIVDWMVYIADARIPAAELPGVHSVEHIGSGTLVVLKDQPIDLDDPADAALVAAVEPVIRRYQKPALPAQTHYPSDAQKH